MRVTEDNRRSEKLEACALPKVNPMNSLFRRLTAVGLTRNFVRETALPTWWDDEIVANPAGYAQGLMLLSRHLGLDLATLQDEKTPLKLRKFGVCKYKKRDNVSEDELAISRVIGTRAAQLAAESASAVPASVPGDATEIRQQILDGNAPWVGLEQLLDYCWSAGVPVLHVDHFPKNARRPDGFAAKVGGRPVIVLCRHEMHSAWLLFILAHELGHIALGHIPDDGILLDEHVDGTGRDAEEQAANEFAIMLLTGAPEKRYVAADRWPNATELAAAAREIGRRELVDPVGVVRERMAERLDRSRLPEDSSEFLLRMTSN